MKHVRTMSAIVILALVLVGDANAEGPDSRMTTWADASKVAHRITTMAMIPPTDKTPGRMVHGDRFGYLRVSEFQDGLIREVWRSKKLEGAVFEVRVDDLNGDGMPQVTVRTYDGHVYIYSHELELVWESLHQEYKRIRALGVGNVDADEALELVILADEGRLDYIDGASFFREFQSIQNYTGTDIAVGNVDYDPQPEIVLNSGFVIDVLTGDSEWVNQPFGTNIELLDIDGDGIDEVLGHSPDSPMRIYSVENQEEEPVR